MAVNVMIWPYEEGFELELTFVAVAACATLCATGAEVLAVKLESPLYLAVTEWEPSEREARVNCAELPDRVAEPSEEPPSKKVTFPVGVPPDED